MKTVRRFLWMVAGLSMFFSTGVSAQQAEPEWHPMLKAIWEDQDSWQLITPADLKLAPDKFIGLHAEYERGENLTSDPLIEQVAFQFEQGWLNGKPALIARYVTSGDPDRPESGPSHWTHILEPTTMTVVEGISGSTRWGAFAERATAEGTWRWDLPTDAEEWSHSDFTEDELPMMDLALWGHLLASIPLVTGKEFRVQGRATWVGPAFRVRGEASFEDVHGNRHDAWAVETNMGRNGWVGTTYVVDEAPYLIGFEMKHVERGDVNIRWRLKGFTQMGG